MEGSLWAVAALCLVSAVHMASLPPSVRDAHQSPLISEAVATYNRESDSEYAFTLLTVEDGHNTELNGTNEAKFTIKETVCHKSDYDEQSECDYKPGGVEKNCSASMEGNRLILICASINGDKTSKQQIVVDKEDLKFPDGEVVDLNEHEMLYWERTVVMKEHIQRISPDGEEEEDVQEEEVQGVPEEEVQGVLEKEVQGVPVGDDDYDYSQPDIVIEFSDDDYETGDMSSEPQNDTQPEQEPQGEIQGRYLCLECIFFDLPRM